MYGQCPHRCEIVYYQGRRAAPGFALVRGTSTHAAIEANMRAKIETGLPSPREAIREIARDTVFSRIDQEGLALTKAEAARGLDRIRGEIVDSAVRLAALHYDELAPRITPLSIERRWALELPTRNVILTGRFDVQVAGGLRDTKTKGKTPPIRAADLSDQLTMYAIAHHILEGSMPTYLSMDNLIDIARPEVLVLETKRTEEDCRRFLLRLDAFLAAMRAGSFPPCPRDSWWCSSKWCGFYDDCEYV